MGEVDFISRQTIALQYIAVVSFIGLHSVKLKYQQQKMITA